MRLILLFSLSIFLFTNCADSPDRPAPVMTQTQHDAVNAESAALQAQKAAQAASASVASPSVLHYYCSAHPNKGGDAQGSCPDCGLALVHNQAFHNATTPSLTGGPGADVPAAVPPAATNAAGVYHYTCSSGHEGGAGSQANCAVCGNPLVHNQAFHN